MEMTVDGEVVYTNHSECGVLPKVELVLSLIEDHKEHVRRRKR